MLVGLLDVEVDVEWAQQLILVLRCKMMEPVLFQDDASTTIIIKDTTGRRMKNKHLTSRRAVLHEPIVTNEEAVLIYKNTKIMLIDPFTKPLEA